MNVLGFLAGLHVVLGQAISPPSQGRSLPECKKKALDLGFPNGQPHQSWGYFNLQLPSVDCRTVVGSFYYFVFNS